jgi:hypothetical protein
VCIGSQGDPFITETSITCARGGGYSGHTGLIYRGVRGGGGRRKGKQLGGNTVYWCMEQL